MVAAIRGCGSRLPQSGLSLTAPENFPLRFLVMREACLIGHAPSLIPSSALLTASRNFPPQLLVLREAGLSGLA
jgi:hypothetical protein